MLRSTFGSAEIGSATLLLGGQLSHAALYGTVIHCWLYASVDQTVVTGALQCCTLVRYDTCFDVMIEFFITLQLNDYRNCNEGQSLSLSC